MLMMQEEQFAQYEQHLQQMRQQHHDDGGNYHHEGNMDGEDEGDELSQSDFLGSNQDEEEAD